MILVLAVVLAGKQEPNNSPNLAEISGIAHELAVYAAGHGHLPFVSGCQRVRRTVVGATLRQNVPPSYYVATDPQHGNFVIMDKGLPSVGSEGSALGCNCTAFFCAASSTAQKYK